MRKFTAVTMSPDVLVTIPASDEELGRRISYSSRAQNGAFVLEWDTENKVWRNYSKIQEGLEKAKEIAQALNLAQKTKG